MSFIGNNPKSDTYTYDPQSADPSNPAEGQVFRSDGTPRPAGLWQFIGGVWQQIGAENTDLSVYQQFNAEDQDVSSFTNVAVSSSSPINGEYSYTISTFPASYGAITLSNRAKADKWNKVTLQASLTSGTARFLVKDNSANTLNEVEFSSTDITSVEIPFFVQSSVTSVVLEVEDVSSATGLKVDDIVFTDDPFTVAQIVKEEHFQVRSTGLSAAQELRYDLSSPQIDTTSEVFTVTDTGVRTEITALTACTLDISAKANGASIGNMSLVKNGTVVIAGTQPTSGGERFVSGTFSAAAGDVFIMNNGEAAQLTTWELSVHGQLTEDNFVTASKAPRNYSQASGDFTLTATGWTTSASGATVYRTSDGVYRMAFNFRGTFAGAGAANAWNIAFSNITLPYEQAVSVTFLGHQSLAADNFYAARMLTNGTVQNLFSNPGIVYNGEWYVSGDIELSDLPTWADPVKGSFLTALPIQSVTLDATGSNVLTGGSVEVTRVDKQVTVSGLTALTFPSATAASSASGFLPTWARPSANKSTVYFTTSSGIFLLSVFSSGAIEVELRNYSGTLINFTNSTANFTISYTV